MKTIMVTKQLLLMMKRTKGLLVLLLFLFIPGMSLMAQQAYESVITNGDFEGTDFSSFSYFYADGGDDEIAVTGTNLVDYGTDTAPNKCFKITTLEGDYESYATQFYIKLSKVLNAGDKIKFSMRAKASKNVSFSKEYHSKPHNYLTNFYDIDGLTTDWDEYGFETTVSISGIQTIAFSLNQKNSSSVDYYFDDISVEVFEPDRNLISVEWDNDVADVEFQDVSNYWSTIGPKESGKWELPSGKTYQMRVDLHNPMVYNINSFTIGGIDATFNSYGWGGTYMFDDLSADKVVKIGFKKVENINTITVNFDKDKTSYVELSDPDNNKYMSVDDGDVTEVPEGSTIRMSIEPQIGWKVSTVTVGNGEPEAYDGNYYEFTDLSTNPTVSIGFEAVATHTITVSNYSEVANILNGIRIGGLSIYNNNTSVEFNEGSNVKMTIACRNSLYSVSIVDNTGDPIPLNKNQYEEYEYVFDNGSLNGDHTVSIVFTKAATNTITVTGGGNVVDVSLREWVASYNNWNWIDPTSSGVWELLSGEGTKYRMKIGIPNSWVYGLESVKLDETTDIKNTILSQGCYDFEDLLADHKVEIVVNKKVANTNTITVNYDYEKTYYVEFFDPEDYNFLNAANGVATELPSGSTIRLMINPQSGWAVKKLTDNGEEVTYNGSYYEFTNLSIDHTVNIEYEAVATHTITVAYDTDHTNYVELNDRGVNNNESREFNEGSDVTMTIYCEDGYKPVLTIDNGEPVTPGKNEYGYYTYVFNNLSADHSVSIAYAQITYHSITVNYDYSDYIDAWLNTAQNKYNWIRSGVENRFEEGEDVTLILDIYQGYALTSLTYRKTNETDEIDILDAYNANGYYKFEDLGSDYVVTATIIEVTTYRISVGFDQYSQGKVYLESAMTGKEEINYRYYNDGSNVTMTIEPAIGYEVSSIIVEDRSNNTKVDVVETYNNNGFKYVFTLSADYDVTITTQKKAMAGIDPIAFTLDDVGMCTYCSEYDLDFTGIEGITAYIASGFNPTTGSVVLTRVEEVPAGTGLVIKGTPGDYEIPANATNYYYMNMLKGIVVPTPVPTYEYSEKFYRECANYTLQPDGIFHISNGSSNPLAANKAYLQIPRNLVPATANSRVLIEWDEDATALKGVKQLNKTDGDYYNMNGQKVKNPQKGIYIKNGKKVIIH